MLYIYCTRDHEGTHLTTVERRWYSASGLDAGLGLKRVKTATNMAVLDEYFQRLLFVSAS